MYKPSKEEIWKLKESTKAGIKNAKKALIETNGDHEAAVDWLKIHFPKKEARSHNALLTVLLTDLSFIVSEILIEEGLWQWAGLGFSAAVTLFGLFFLRMTIAYSVQNDVGAGKDPLLVQLGVAKKNGCLMEMVQLPLIFLPFLVSTASTLMCFHGMLIDWHNPKGIDGIDPSGFLKLIAVVLFFGSIFVAYSAESLFKAGKVMNSQLSGETNKKRNQPKRKQAQDLNAGKTFFTVLPFLCVFLGACMSHYGSLMFDFFMQNEVHQADGEMGFMMFLYVYLPVRYMLTRICGTSWLSMALSGLTILFFYFY